MQDRTTRRGGSEPKPQEQTGRRKELNFAKLGKRSWSVSGANKAKELKID